MKKILSFIIAAALAIVMPIISSAAEQAEITQDTEEKSGNINVDYNLGVEYTVTIPASVTFTDTQKTVQRGLLASNVIINEGTTLNINMSSLNDFKMKNGDGYISYHMLLNTNIAPDKNNYNILSVDAGEGSGWVILDFITELEKGNALYAGKYSDTLTFTVSVVPNE